jgi:hypothetical protein
MRILKFWKYKFDYPKKYWIFGLTILGVNFMVEIPAQPEN